MPAASGLPPFAPVSTQLLDMLSREDAVVGQVAELLRLDPGYVAQALRPAGPPAFGFERQVRALAHVVVRLGAGRVRALIATMGAHQSSRAHGAVRGYWRHNVASGFLAAETADAWNVPDRDDTGAFSSPGDVPAAQLGMPAEGAAVESLTEAVGAALQMPVMPRPWREHFRADPALLARALKEETAFIAN